MKNEAIRADELVWQVSGIAHELIQLDQELEAYYPELVPFLQYLARTYPAVKANNESI